MLPDASSTVHSGRQHDYLVGSGNGAVAPQYLQSPVSSSRRITRSVGISRPKRSCTLHDKGYGAYQVGAIAVCRQQAHSFSCAPRVPMAEPTDTGHGYYPQPRTRNPIIQMDSP
jgi:hypothetical protein